MKKWLAALIFLSLVTIVTACTQITGGSTATGPNPVHMDDTTFKTSSITIHKGESVTLINDVPIIHVIANGTWNNGTPQPETEPGAPKIDNLQITGSGSGSIGPFNTAGTFKIYCTVHSDMKMTVIVK